MKVKTNAKTLSRLVDDQYGKKGSHKRDKFEKGYQSFKLGAILLEARLEKGMTQEQPSEKDFTRISEWIKKDKKAKEIKKEKGQPEKYKDLA